MDGGAWWATVHGVSKSRTRLSEFTFTFHFRALEKEMATHSSVLAWRIPGTGEPGGLPSMGLHRVGHDWSDLAAAAAAYQILNTSHHLLNDTYPQLARDCWLCLSLGAPWYLATPVPLKNATDMGIPIDPPLQGPVLRTIELTQKVPKCFTNDGRTELVGNLARDECNQMLKGEWPTHLPTNTILCHPH